MTKKLPGGFWKFSLGPELWGVNEARPGQVGYWLARQQGSNWSKVKQWIIKTNV